MRKLKKINALVATGTPVPAKRVFHIGQTFLIIGLMISVTLTMVFADSKPSNQFEYQVPFTTPLGYNIPVIHAKANGTTDMAIVIDTGTTANLISASLATKLGLKPEPYLTDGEPYLINGKPASYVTVSSLGLTGSNDYLPNFGFLVVDDKYLSRFTTPIDGVIGLGMLSVNAILIDYSHDTITFMYPGNLTEDEIAALGFHPKEKVLTLTKGDDGLFRIPVQLQNGAYSATEDIEVDTGSAQTSISHQVADQLHLKAEGKEKDSTLFNGNISESDITVPSITVGPTTAAGMITFLNKDIEGSPPRLGEDILSQARVLLDFPALKMYLAPPKDITQGSTSSPAQAPGQGSPPTDATQGSTPSPAQAPDQGLPPANVSPGGNSPPPAPAK